jgi:hypothetical protein
LCKRIATEYFYNQFNIFYLMSLIIENMSSVSSFVFVVFLRLASDWQVSRVVSNLDRWASCCFLEQEIIHSLICTVLFQERINSLICTVWFQERIRECVDKLIASYTRAQTKLKGFNNLNHFELSWIEFKWIAVTIIDMNWKTIIVIFLDDPHLETYLTF